ncbi:kelch repeat domain [Anaeramoeba flamelloides]|uniref:Kelch repeat domain n=1 Tax=Anaeramoeba flamelloides TaxID=1746091 RepID=A0ABQ8X3C5_9EUKA|nr:kelch repeat domain [Anaeramoeba flamelloides]
MYLPNIGWYSVPTHGQFLEVSQMSMCKLPNEDLIVCFGYGPEGYALRFMQLSVKDLEWRSLCDVSSFNVLRRVHCSTSYYENGIYVFGGRSESNTLPNELWRFDLTTHKFKLIKTNSKNLKGRYGHTSIVYEDKMYIFGGIDKDFMKTGLLVFDFLKGEWITDPETAGTPISDRSFHSACLYKYFMVIYGGEDSETELSNEVRMLDLINMTWDDGGEMYGEIPDRVKGHSSVVFKDSMVIFGGENVFGEANNKTYSFNLALSQWTRLDDATETTESLVQFDENSNSEPSSELNSEQEFKTVNRFNLDLKNNNKNKNKNDNDDDNDNKNLKGLQIIKQFGIIDKFKFSSVTQSQKIDSIPQPRVYHSSVLTESYMIVIGGMRTTRNNKFKYFNDIHVFRFEGELIRDMQKLLKKEIVADLELEPLGLNTLKAHSFMVNARVGSEKINSFITNSREVTESVLQTILYYLYTDILLIKNKSERKQILKFAKELDWQKLINRMESKNSKEEKRKNEKKFVEDMEKLIEEQDGKDVTIIANNKDKKRIQVKVHRAMLCLRFGGDFLKLNTDKIDDKTGLSEKALNILIRYIYTGVIANWSVDFARQMANFLIGFGVHESREIMVHCRKKEMIALKN